MKRKAGLHFIVLMALVAGVVMSGGTADAAASTSTPGISVGDVQITEGSGGTINASFLVTLDKSSGRIITVDYATADGTALAGADYAQASGRLTINKRETKAVLNVAILSDAVDEPDETLQLRLSNPAGGAVIADGVGIGTILDDDETAPPPAPAEIRITDVDVIEGTGGLTNAAFTLTLDRQWGQVVTIDYATADVSAVAGEDYAPANGTVAFHVGQTSRTLNISVAADSTDESDELFELRLDNASGGAVIADATGEAHIADDDDPPPPPPSPAQLTVSDVTVNEGTGGSTPATFVLSLDREPGTMVTVDYVTLDGTAKAGTDFALAAGTVAFSARTTTVTVQIPVLGDDEDEPDEDFAITIGNPSPGVTIADGIGVATIVDDDAPPETPVDLAVTLSVERGFGSDFVVEDSHPVGFAMANPTGGAARGVLVRFTFDQTPMSFSMLPAECRLLSGPQVVCSYGDTTQGASGAFRVAYDLPGSYSITATVESQTPDPAVGNNARTAFLNVRNRRGDWTVAVIGGFDQQQQLLPPAGSGLPTIWQDPSDEGFVTGSDYSPQVVLEKTGPDPVRGRLLVRTRNPSGFNSGRITFAWASLSVPPGTASCASVNSSTVLDCPLPWISTGTLVVAFEFDPNDAGNAYTVSFEAEASVSNNPDGTPAEATPGNNVLTYDVGAIRPVYDLEPETAKPQQGETHEYSRRRGETLRLWVDVLNFGPAAGYPEELRITIPAGFIFQRYALLRNVQCDQPTLVGTNTVLLCRATAQNPTNHVRMWKANLTGNDFYRVEYEISTAAAAPNTTYAISYDISQGPADTNPGNGTEFDFVRVGL